MLKITIVYFCCLFPHGESGLNLVDEKLCDSEMIYENFNIIDQNM